MPTHELIVNLLAVRQLSFVDLLDLSESVRHFHAVLLERRLPVHGRIGAVRGISPTDLQRRPRTAHLSDDQRKCK